MMYSLVDVDRNVLEVEEEKLRSLPYFDALLNNRSKMKVDVSETNSIKLDSEIRVNYVEYILRYLNEGCDALHLIIVLPVTFTEIPELLTTLDFLGLQLDLDTNNSHETLTQVKKLDDRNYGHFSSKETHNIRDVSRNMAANLIFALHKSEVPMSDHKDKLTLYNDLLFIASHSATFGPRLRFRAFEAARKYCHFITAKQWVQLNKWDRDRADTNSESEDCTDDTEEEGTLYDSDDEDDCGRGCMSD